MQIICSGRTDPGTHGPGLSGRPAPAGIRSREDGPDHAALDVGQAVIAAADAVGQSRVIDPAEVQHRGVEVVEVGDVLDGLHAELVGGAVDRAAPDAAAGQEDGEALRVVVAAVGAGGVGRPAELAGPEDQRALEQPALLEVLDQGGDRPVGLPGVPLVARLEVAVLVPGAVDWP